MSTDLTTLKRLLLFPQDKGGIGKSFIAALIHDYLTEAGVRTKAFDLDHANSTFNRLVPSAEFIDTDVAPEQLGELDRLILAFGEADTVLVDNRATGGGKLLEYLDTSRLDELQAELGVRVVFILIATDDKDANSQIAELLDSHTNSVAWIVARNSRGGSLAQFDQSLAHKRLLELGAPLSRGTCWGSVGCLAHKRLLELGAPLIEIPCLYETTRARLQQHNLTVGRGRTAPELHLLDRSRCVRLHTTMRTAFEGIRHLLAG
jgi:hypothetical protein